MQNTLPAEQGTSSLSETNLSGPEKAASLFIILGQENASPLLAGLSAREVESLTFQIGRIRAVSSRDRLEILRECRMLLLTKEYILQGGLDYAKSLLSSTMTQADADKMIGRVQRLLEGNPFDFMEQANPANLLDVLRHEHPQIIALILAHLSAGQSSAVIQGLPPETKLDVVRRIAAMQHIDQAVIDMLNKSLKGKISSLLQTPQNQIGGPQKVAEILNLADSASEKQVMSGLSEGDPELAEQVQALMFTFDDLEYIETMGIQRILAQAKQTDIILALKAASDTLKEKFLSSVSSRNAESIAEELAIMGRVPLKDVEEAQQKLVGIAKDLEESGEIVIMRGGGDDSEYI